MEPEQRDQLIRDVRAGVPAALALEELELSHLDLTRELNDNDDFRLAFGAAEDHARARVLATLYREAVSEGGDSARRWLAADDDERDRRANDEQLADDWHSGDPAYTFGGY
jgi:hypothetical protein